MSSTDTRISASHQPDTDRLDAVPVAAVPAGEAVSGRATVGRRARHGAAGGNNAAGGNGSKRAVHRWARWLHVYTSMIALLIVLFFGITGITLNHPDWTFGDATSRDTITGTLAVDSTFEDGSVDWLTVAEATRADYGVKGTVSDFGLTGTEGSIVFTNPGYSANLFFDTADGTFDLTVEQQGFVAVMNDLHKGRDTGAAWRWVIDLSAGFLVAISVTGLTMQFFLRRRRRSAIITAIVGAIITVVLIWITVS